MDGQVRGKKVRIIHHRVGQCPSLVFAQLVWYSWARSAESVTSCLKEPHCLSRNRFFQLFGEGCVIMKSNRSPSSRTSLHHKVYVYNANSSPTRGTRYYCRQRVSRCAAGPCDLTLYTFRVSSLPRAIICYSELLATKTDGFPLRGSSDSAPADREKVLLSRGNLLTKNLYRTTSRAA